MKRKNKDYYDTGLPFSHILKKNVIDCLEEIEKKKASLIIIDGKMGEGKTTLAYQIGQLVETYYNKTEQIDFYNPLLFDMKKQIGCGGIRFKEKLQICNKEKLKIVVYDEAGDFSRRSAISSFNQDLNRIFQTFRTFRILVIVCLPLFNILDNNFFDEGVPKLLLNCYGRNESDGNIRGYGYDEMLWLKFYMEKEKVKKQKCYKKVSPNFRANFIDLPKDLSNKLDMYSTTQKEEILDKSIMKNKNISSYKELANKTGRSVVWVKNKVKRFNIKESQVYKREKYFDNGIIDRLKDEL